MPNDRRRNPNDTTSDTYSEQYLNDFVDHWDQLIDWDGRARSEGDFLVQQLRARGVRTVLDVATGTGFHSVSLLRAGFDVTSTDGAPQMLRRAAHNARAHDCALKSRHADWRALTRDVRGRFDAVVCLGNSFTHLFSEVDRRRALPAATEPVRLPAQLRRSGPCRGALGAQARRTASLWAPTACRGAHAGRGPRRRASPPPSAESVARPRTSARA